MKTKVIKALAAIMLLGASPLASADIVSLDLFDLGCQTLYDSNSSVWTTNFDLGITFTEISNVSIDWSGEITAGLAILYNNPDERFAKDVGIRAYLQKPPNWRHTTFWGGERTYPFAELFDLQSDFLYGGMPWSELFDGQGTITIDYTELIMGDGTYVEHGVVVLTSATFIIDGTIVPEPATLLILCFGTFAIRLIKPKT